MKTDRVFTTSFSAGELSEKMTGRFDSPAYGKGLKTLENFLVIPQGGVTKRPGTQFLGECYNSGAAKARILGYVYSESESYIIELSAARIRVWRNGTAITDAAAPWDATQVWEVSTCQNHKGMYFAHSGYTPRCLIRTATDTFTFGEIAYIYTPGQALTSMAAPSNEAGDVTFAVQEAISGPNQQGLFKVKYATGQSDEYTYTSWSGGLFSGVSPALARDYDASATVVVGHEFDSDGVTTPFSGTNNYPRAIAIFNGRFWFAGSLLDRQRVWASKPYTDVYDGNVLTVDMRTNSILVSRREEQTPSDTWADPAEPETETVTYTRAIITEDSGIQIDIGSDMNDSIMSLTPGRELFLFTTSAEWIIPSTITARSPSAQIQSRVGSSTIQPRFVWDILAFLQSSDKQLRAYTYTQEGGGYKPPDLTRLSDHILGAGGAVQLAFQQEPRCLLLLPRSDGELAVFTHEPDAGVMAWQRWKHADGTFISGAVVPESGEDVVYAVVYRNSKYYLEKFTDPFPATQSELRLFDSSYHAKGASGADPLTLMSGNTLTATWLNGDTVAVWDDGVETEETFTGNTLDLSAYSGEVYVGLTYTHKLETMPLMALDEAGPMQMKEKRASKVLFRLYKSATLKVIDDSWTVADADDYSLGDTWVTTDVEVPFPGGFARDATVRVVGKDAKPLTILAMSVEVVSG